jgi:protein involved in temperature-dependent protein secretion
MDYHAMQEQRARRATLPAQLRAAAETAPQPEWRELLAAAAEAIAYLEDALRQAQQDLRDEIREAGRDVRAAVSEARWTERSDADGVPHGSY